MTGVSYVQRQITVTFTLHTGTFTGTSSNQLTLSGLRITATATLFGANSYNALTASIFGIPLSVMNDLTTLGKMILDNTPNMVAVYAGDAQSGLSLIFTGGIYAAWANFESAPEVSFDIEAQVGKADAIAAIPPSSYQGGADVATIIQNLASQMTPPRAFQNNGVSVYLANPYYRGTATDQIKAAAADAHIVVDDDGTTISIWPMGGSRGGAIPLISPATGLVGYPRYTKYGMDIVSLFNPQVRFGSQVQVESILKGASGTFSVIGVIHNLQSQTPNGNWFTAMRLVDPVVFSQGKFEAR